ncbi:MAG: hypothetical protein ACOX2F_08685 [bacterium]
MLLPFDKNYSYIGKFKSAFLPTLVRDVFEFEKVHGGLIVCLAEKKIGYILFNDKKIIAARSFFYNSKNALPKEISFFELCRVNEFDVYVNSVENKELLAFLKVFFSSEIVLSAPYELCDVRRVIGKIEAEKERGLLCFTHGTVTNFVTFADGIMESLCYYNSDTKQYALERDSSAFNSYLLHSEKLKPFVIYRRELPKESCFIDKSDVEFFSQNPTLEMLVTYTELFELIHTVFKKKSTALAMSITSKLLDDLKKKFAPLYETINYSVEEGKVNWLDFYKERKFVPKERLYNNYHLYPDLVLNLLFKISLNHLDKKNRDVLVENMKKYVAEINKTNPIIKELADRVDKMLEIVK